MLGVLALLNAVGIKGFKLIQIVYKYKIKLD